MDGATVCQEQEMHRVTCYVLSTEGLGLRINPIETKNKWIPQVLSDSDFANDLETRISIYGFVVYWCGMPVSWNSKGMRNVDVPFQVEVFMDNGVAIWLANNRSTRKTNQAC
jgi:hypothetical protein